MQRLGPKDLFRRFDEMAAQALADDELGRALARLGERVVQELGPELGLRAVQGAPEPRALAEVRIEAPRGPHVLAFALAPGADPERVELVVNTLHAVLAARLARDSLASALRQAAEIQQSLLPERAPAFAGYDLAVRAVAAEEVGGDLHDFLALDEDTLGLAVGDASGHGLPAALLVRDVVVGLRMGMEKDLRPEHALARLNRVIHGATLSSTFVSLFYAELERNGNLFYFNAGHEPPLLFAGGPAGQSAPASALPGGDVVLGPLEHARFKRHFAHVDHGATLAVYSDGLVERCDPAGELFGVARLERTVREALGRPSHEVVARVFAAASAFGAERPWDDDATLLVLRRLP